MELVSVLVTKYKSIENSTKVKIEEDITVLVGKNESGKTAFLEAINKSRPLDSSKFEYIFDYPRKDLVGYRPRHDAKAFDDVTVLRFRVGTEIADKINADLFGKAAVVPASLEFSWPTNYGLAHEVKLCIDEAKALLALKTRFGGIELAEEVFANAASFEEVVSRIDDRGLPADNTLVAFAKEFERPPTGSKWKLVDYRIWTKYISPRIPQCLYFDDYHLLSGKINLDDLNRKKTSNPANLTKSDETALGLLDLAGTTVPELMSEEGYESSKAKLEAIGLTISQEIFKYWKQNKEIDVEFDIKADPRDQPPFNSGKNLYVRIKNRRHGVTVPFDQRSKGFIWFFSFMVWFFAVERREKTSGDVLLLLDEPGLNLHALAQRDLLSYIGELAKSRQIIFTTHSPFMVDSQHLERVRVVEDDPSKGTTIVGDLSGSSDESLFPLQAALGYSIAQNLFISKKNLVVEGPADLILLQHMNAMLQAQHKQGLGDAVIVPVGGMNKLATFVALLGANDLDIVVMHDRGSAPFQQLEELVKQKLIAKKRVLDYSMFRTPAATEADIEDLLPVATYIEAFNAAYEGQLGAARLTALSLPEHPRIVERINLWLASEKINLLNAGGYNHYRVAQALLPLLNRDRFSDEEFGQFERLFERVSESLEPVAGIAHS